MARITLAEILNIGVRYTQPEVKELVQTNLRGRDFISIHDFTIEEIHTLMSNAFDLKRKLSRGEPHELLKGKSLGMIFTAPSTRTRVSFETAMTQLGGHAQNLQTLHTITRAKEPWKDTARVLSRYIDAIAIRGPYLEPETTIYELAEYSSIPVINMETYWEHPCQAMADAMTIKEQKGKWEGVKCIFQWGWRPELGVLSTLTSFTLLAPKLGMDIIINCPEGYDPPKRFLEWAKGDAEITGSKVEVTHDYKGAVEGADVIRQMNWNPTNGFEMLQDRMCQMNWNPTMGIEVLQEELPHIKDPKKYKHWIANEELIDLADRNVIFLQGLPCMRGIELTDEVIEGPHSRVWDEAENRLHAQKAVLACTMR